MFNILGYHVDMDDNDSAMFVPKLWGYTEIFESRIQKTFISHDL